LKGFAIPKKISFYQFAQPGLQDGNYSLVTDQSVSSVSGEIPATTYSNETRFSVTGPRFSLNPGDVISMFPPPFSLGEFSNVLPHVVLSRNTLPWERSPDISSPINDIPWLGIVVFDEGDPIPPTLEMDLLDLLPLGEKTGSNPKDPVGKLPENTFYPTFPRRPNSNYPDLDFGESWSDKCFAIDIPKDFFNRIMPTAEDLGWLAQVREIELLNKSETYLRQIRQIPPGLKAARLQSVNPESNDTSDTDLNPVGQVAEVIGNRFVLPGKRSTVHLVCLEQFGPYLPGAAGASNLPDNITTVRVVSLKSWTFSAVSQEYTFAGLLLKVNKPGGVFTHSTLQAPFQGTGKTGDAAVANAFQMGMAAFNHTTRLGDKTVSWFHGPFVPYNLETTLPFPGNVADQFTRYNPDSGMFDISYSAAWQLGRLMGLQSSAFSSALYDWKRKTTQAVIQSVEKEFLNLPYAGMLSLLLQSLGNYTEASGADSPSAAPGARAAKPSVAAPAKVMRPNRAVAIRQTLTDPQSIQAVLTEDNTPELPAAVIQFLSRLRLLYGIPFNYLVPDERMLPSESLRFFYLDSAWVDSLLEGALSLGNSTSGDAAVSQALNPQLHAQSHAGARRIRPLLLQMPVEMDSASITPVANVTGFLLRSQVVTGWPGMEVHGFDGGGIELEILRLEQVGPGVLLAIFDGVVNQLVLNEHPEALHFGVDENNDDPSPEKFSKSFRYITELNGHSPGSPVSTEIATPLVVKDYTRSETTSVLRISDFAEAMKAELQATQIYAESFTSAEFALEMIEGVGRVFYTFTAK